jgi:hypothetical protein
LRGTKSQVESIVGKLSNDDLQKSHWMPVDLDRRYNDYEQNNMISNFKAALDPSNGV